MKIDYKKINTNSWDLYDFVKEVEDCSVLDMLNMLDEIEQMMNVLGAKAIKTKGVEKEKCEEEFYYNINKKYFLLERIVDIMRGK